MNINPKIKNALWIVFAVAIVAVLRDYVYTKPRFRTHRGHQRCR